MTRGKTDRLDRREFIKRSAIVGAMAASATSQWTNARADEEIAAQTNVKTPKFEKAVPVWAKGRAEEMNVTLAFSAAFDLRDANGVKGAILRVTGASVMRITVNGKYVGYGPARGPHGWFRVDEWDLSGSLEIAGYNSNSFDILDQPSFLQAEIVDGKGRVVAATLASPSRSIVPFTALDFTGIRVQKVQRFSFQRPFIEVYDLHERKIEDFEEVELERQPDVKYLPRRVPYPEFAIFEPKAWLKRGTVAVDPEFKNFWRDRSLVNIGPELKGYKMEELEVVLSDEMQRLKTTFVDDKPLEIGSTFKEGDVQIVDFGAEYSGFFGLEVGTKGETEIVVTFDEILSPEGDVNFLRLGTVSAIKWSIDVDEPNRMLEAISPQVGRYAKIHCLKGAFKLKKFYLREYAYPPTRDASFDCSDKRLNKVYQAAALTFRENSVDLFTDCPHRERAGWLCDSFFTARSAFDFTGKTDVETAFYENYMLPDSFKCLPEGMLPMCYPADHYDGVFIPNWAMWFVVELGEYTKRECDPAIVKGLETKIVKLLDFLKKYENSDGLLEKLPNWVFVEWSKANEFVQDVNYPSNMCYAAVLETAGKLYKNDEWLKRAEEVREKVREQSFDGEFFVDHAVRKEDGSLEILRDRSEICQYFAFFFRTATPESHPELWKTLIDKFGPHRTEKGDYPEVHKANAFVGNVLRLEIIAMARRGDQLLDESLAYNEYMADRTGTLWENDLDYASCNHGFASHVAHVFYRDILGVANVDCDAKKIEIRIPKIESLEWCAGVRPVPGGAIKLRWEKAGEKVRYTLETPDGYDVAVDGDVELERA